MPTPHIRVDHESLAQISKTFARQAMASQQLHKRIRREMDNLQGGDWIGKGAAAFYREMEGDVLPAVKRLSSAMGIADRVTRQISQIMSQTDEEIARLIKAMDPGGTGAASPGLAAASGGGKGLSPEAKLARDLLAAAKAAGTAASLASAFRGAARIAKIAKSTTFGRLMAGLDGAIEFLDAKDRGVSTGAAAVDGTIAAGLGLLSNPVEAVVGLVHGVTSAISPDAGKYTAIANDMMPTNVAKGLATGTVDTADALIRRDYDQLIKHHNQNLNGKYGEVIRGYAIGADALGALVTGDNRALNRLSDAAADGRLGPLAKAGDWLGGAVYDLLH